MTHTILAVDDEPYNLVLLESYLDETECDVRSFGCGASALDYLRAGGPADLILLDRMMPNMDGLGFMKALKMLDDRSMVPVVMQTAAATASEVAEGIAAGAYYYLTKPFSRNVLVAVVRRALIDREIQIDLQKAATGMAVTARNMEQLRLWFRTLEDVREISAFVASLFPDPAAAVLGISELMINAVEHGNLGIGYDKKSELTLRGQWSEEIEQRLRLPEYRDRRARISFERNAHELILTIEDAGAGFDWGSFTDFESVRSDHSHGRGIAMARMVSFDDVQYLAPGNKVVCRTSPRREANTD